MKRTLLLLVGGLAFATFAASLRVSGLGTARAQELDIKPNSCTISCPAGSAYANLSGSVGCADGFAPVCQCATRESKMAGCQTLTATP